MSTIVLSGDTSGAITIAAPAVAGTNTLTLPANTGTVLTTASVYGTTGPAFSAYLGTNQSISSGTNTKIQINTKIFDTNTNFDATTNYRFTPTVAGYYQINATIAGGSVNYIAAVLRKNNADYLYSFSNSAFGLSAQVATVMYFNGSTDYVELYATCNANTTIYAGATQTLFSGCLIRSA